MFPLLPNKELSNKDKTDLNKKRFGFSKIFLILAFAVGTVLPLHVALVDSMPIYAQAADRSIAVVGVSGATLRDAPNGASLATWPSGKAVVASSRTADSQWIFVSASDGASGWVDVDLLVIFGVGKLPVGTASGQAASEQAASGQAASEQAASSQSGSTSSGAESSSEAQGDRITVKINTGGLGLNVRSGPGSAYGIVGSLPDNSIAIAIGRNASGEWYKLTVSSIRSGSGWVAARYLDLGSNATTANSTLALLAAPALPVQAPPVQSPPVQSPPVQAPPVQAATPQPAVAPQVAQSLAATAQPVTAQPITVVIRSQPVASTVSSGNTGLSGTLVFQTSLGGTFHAYDLQSGRTWPLTYGFDAEISPDGQRVAFVRTGGANGLYVIDITGQNERRIFSDRQWLASPKWSPSGDEIVFSYYDGNDQCQRGDNCDNQRREYRLSVVDTNGDNYHDLATIDSARAPDWNQSGIVYQSGDGIQITEDKHKAKNRLVTFDYLQPQYHDPDWQPNGGKIAFMVKHASHWQIHTVYQTGAGQAAITRPLTSLVDVLPSNVAPAYSPDGNHIVYVSNRGAGENAGDWGIWVMNADGSNQRKLPITMAINYTFGDEQAVSWGP